MKAIKELKEFQTKLQATKLSTTTKEGAKKDYTWNNLCIKANGNCVYGESILTFATNSNGVD